MRNDNTSPPFPCDWIFRRSLKRRIVSRLPQNCSNPRTWSCWTSRECRNGLSSSAPPNEDQSRASLLARASREPWRRSDAGSLVLFCCFVSSFIAIPITLGPLRTRRICILLLYVFNVSGCFIYVNLILNGLKRLKHRCMFRVSFSWSGDGVS